MKIIYSEIKKWLPDLKDDAKSVRDNLTQIGHFVSGFEEIDSEIVLDLEIRSNRADCLSYYGIARELATFYNLDLQIPEIKSFQFSESSIPITINSPDVYRIQATKISNLKNSPSPSWLIKFLKLHDINSINTLVDLTNYVMLQWGIPCHAFDLKKSSELIWENNQNYSEFTSLDGSKIKLSPKNLLITDSQKVLSLSFIGSENSSIDLNTTDSILEMAIYNPSRVRSDSRSLKTITEASIRLDKELDTQTIPLAFSHLLSLLITHCGAIISSQLLDIYPKVPSKITIEFDPSSPASYAGINIPTDFSLDVLKHLGCSIIKNLKSSLLISPPSLRKDLNLSEDLIEEVIRFYGYYKIPIDTPVDSQTLPDITPPILYLIENLKDQLLALGYDEIRSWPLVKTPLDKNAIFTQNSINSDYPVLRQSLIQSLKTQLDQYRRFKLPAPQFFEIGKIYFQKNGQYLEQNALAIYHYDSQKLESDLNLVAPVKGRYPKGRGVDSNFTEIILDDLPKPKKYLPTFSDSKAIELTSQIITLDANLNLDSPRDPLDLIKEYSTKINPKILWSIEIIDVYKNRYTFRVSYYNCDDKTAKKIHLSTFNLL
ncbi:MAG: phenylalanine--tRNA ligase beta subunit-related protein [Candidatus Shapirobacteria bacterium]|nr:phenylalanine--tRNA ligase beta subunit-related protein [Candidatus Shapirobacteria bacterium]